MAHRFQAGSIKEKPLKCLSEATNFIRSWPGMSHKYFVYVERIQIYFVEP